MNKIRSQIIPALFAFAILLVWQIPQDARAQVLPKLASQTTPERSKTQCEAGDGSACAVHGFFSMSRRPNPDLPKAITYFTLSCQLNSGLGCFSLGSFQAEGVGMIVNMPVAITNFEKACTLNYDDGCIHLGFMYYRGSGIGEDKLKAIEYFGKSCLEVRVRGCIYHRQLALLQNVTSVHPMRTEVAPVIRGSERQNAAIQDWANQRYSNANPRLSDLCDTLQNYTCVIVGQSYFEGLGVSKNHRVAADYFEKACQSGVAEGCNGLGNAFSHGEGREKDAAKAVENYTKACDKGVVDACFNLGVSNYLGESMPKNLPLAVELFYDSCTQRHINACFNMAAIYMQDDDNNDNTIAQTALNRVLMIDPANERARSLISALQASQ